MQARASRAGFSDRDVSDAYIYLLARLLVLRQQQLDFNEGFGWNQLVHRKIGGVHWPNPNVDVAYSEAWIAVDEQSCIVISVPQIADRYYTLQFLNGWGETLGNINERTFPAHPCGEYAICLKGADVRIPPAAVRLDLPVKYARLVVRIELGADWEQALVLQHRFTLHATGKPKLPGIPKTPIFELEQLPGVEAFDAGPLALETEPDLNPGIEPLQHKVYAIAAAVKDQARRGHVDRIVRERTFAELEDAVPTMRSGTMRNGWVRPATSGTYGRDYVTRTLVNLTSIWSNTHDEVIYYRCHVDNTGAPLNGDHVYALTFDRWHLPAGFAKYFWSIIVLHAKQFRMLPNPMNRFFINSRSNLQYESDGSLVLRFAASRPSHSPNGNWLPTPVGQAFRLTIRFFGPLNAVKDGSYFPPPLVKQE